MRIVYIVGTMFLIAIVLAACTNNFLINSSLRSYENSDGKGLSRAQNSQSVDLSDGAIFNISTEKIIKNINGQDFVMYGYNGEIPGPLLRVKQGSTIKINFTNHLDKNTTIHWHGLRHNYKDDGVPGVSQDPVKPGESFIYTLYFPDEGIFWYHPHVREDAQQSLGLYGNIFVEPKDNKYNKVDKEEFLMISDILIEDKKIVPYGVDNANYALMGRFGNTMLVNGLTDYTLSINKGDTVRFYLTVSSNVRPFNISFGDAPIKLIGSDMGRYEKETITDSIIIGPAERYVVEVTFDKEGVYNFSNTNIFNQYTLGKIIVNPSNKKTEGLETHDNQDVKIDIDKYRKYFDKPIDVQVNLGIELNNASQEMHDIENMEWEDLMGEFNARVNSNMIQWYIEDAKTKQRNSNLTYEFKKGDVEKILFVNSRDSQHPMQHMIHLHGQRFIVLEEDGVKNTNLVWKDTFLIRTGSNVTILLDASNPGEWMFHCHIAEHLESGMMSMFKVE